MKSLLLLIASATAGLVFGWQMKTRGDSMNNASSEDSENESSRPPAAEPAAVTPAPRQSADTAMVLHALPTEDLYDRMALFLLEAEAGDFPVFYEEFKKRSDRSTDLNELLFIAWTRVDPEAAIAASRGADDFRYAYWAWACHDPGAALASAKERDEGLENAISGIGEFHPKWLSEHWDLIPETQRENALQGLAKWPDTETPEITLRLLLQSDESFTGKIEQTLLALAREDPMHAYQLVKEFSINARGFSKGEGLEALIASLSRDEPALLGEIVAATKNPIDKMKLQLGQFEGLLRDDPEAAKTMIESAPKSWLKDDLAVAYANHLLAADPEGGFKYAVDLLKNDAAHSDNIIWYLSMNLTNNVESRQLISNLLQQDAPSLLNELLPESSPAGGRNIFQGVSDQWASQDVSAYAEWLGNHQDDRQIYDAGASKIVEILRDKGEYEAGMEWAQSIPDDGEKPKEHVESYYYTWRSRDPEGAAAWRLSDQFTGDPDKFPLPESK